MGERPADARGLSPTVGHVQDAARRACEQLDPNDRQRENRMRERQEEFSEKIRAVRMTVGQEMPWPRAAAPASVGLRDHSTPWPAD